MLTKTFAVLALTVTLGLLAVAAEANTQVAKQGSVAEGVMLPDVFMIPAGIAQPGNNR